jgi:chemotaxis protein methyltransferase CheR
MNASDPPQLHQADFEKISRLAYDNFGLNLADGKQALVSARLAKEMRRLGYESFTDYYRQVCADSTGQSLMGLIDALTTNYTAFLREPQHFELLMSLAATELRHASPLLVWSAACSSGEEPYSIAMTLAQAARPARILATDISTRVLETARRAIYPAEKLEPFPDSWKRAFLLRGTGKASGKFQIKREIRALVEFRRLNLLDHASPGEFHFIFCRNVMIYFDRSTQQRIAARLAHSLHPGGYLFIGHSETLNGLDQPLRYVRPSVYRREDRP